MHPIIDTHQHLWDLSRFRLPWVHGIEAFDRSFLPSDYATAVDGLNVARSVYMEVDVSVDQRGAEVDYVGQLCREEANPMAAAVVSGSPADPDFAGWIERLTREPHVRGVRQVLHVPTAPAGTCLQPAFLDGVHRLGQAGLLYDVCLRPAELADAVELADRCPDTTFVLDHCGNGDPQVVSDLAQAEEGPFAHTADQWRRDIAALGQHRNVVCKISGIVARAPEGWSADTLAPTIDHCLDAFGPDRVVFGGDWPVCTLGASYAEWATALRKVISRRSDDDQRRLLHDNAARIYALD